MYEGWSMSYWTATSALATWSKLLPSRKPSKIWRDPPPPACQPDGIPPEVEAGSGIGLSTSIVVGKLVSSDQDMSANLADRNDIFKKEFRWEESNEVFYLQTKILFQLLNRDFFRSWALSLLPTLSRKWVRFRSTPVLLLPAPPVLYKWESHLNNCSIWNSSAHPSVQPPHHLSLPVLSLPLVLVPCGSANSSSHTLDPFRRTSWSHWHAASTTSWSSLLKCTPTRTTSPRCNSIWWLSILRTRRLRLGSTKSASRRWRLVTSRWSASSASRAVSEWRRRCGTLSLQTVWSKSYRWMSSSTRIRSCASCSPRRDPNCSHRRQLLPLVWPRRPPVNQDDRQIFDSLSHKQSRLRSNSRGFRRDSHSSNRAPYLHQSSVRDKTLQATISRPKSRSTDMWAIIT